MTKLICEGGAVKSSRKEVSNSPWLDHHMQVCTAFSFFLSLISGGALLWLISERGRVKYLCD